MADTPDIPLLAALGLEVRERRRARGLTLKQLGERAGVSERFLSSLEGGQGVENSANSLLTDLASTAFSSVPVLA